jgi:hypothetical protein
MRTDRQTADNIIVARLFNSSKIGNRFVTKKGQNTERLKANFIIEIFEPSTLGALGHRSNNPA